MRSVKITRSELPGLLPKGSRCDFYSTPIAQLRAGDVVVLPNGHFARCLLRHGNDLWVTDQSGLHVERHSLVGSLYRADVQASKFGWLAGSCLGLVSSLPQLRGSRTPQVVEADPRQLWRAPKQ